MSVVLGVGPVVGETLTLAVGVSEGSAVGETDGLGRPVDGATVGPDDAAAVGGGVLASAEGLAEDGAPPAVAGERGARGVTPPGSRTLLLPGWVSGRPGDGDALGGVVVRCPGSSGVARSGVGAACGRPMDFWGSSAAVPRPPSTAKAAAARVRPPYFFRRGAPCRAEETSVGGDAARETPAGSWTGPSPRRTSGTAVAAGDGGGCGCGAETTDDTGSWAAVPNEGAGDGGPGAVVPTADVASVAGTPGAIWVSYAPHSGHVTAPLRGRRQGEQ
ncbi:hypothetical protein [Streptomyces sp. NPDC059176]|uniref:hypothetical protein n=1 Tax=unclassified Streptomyces TaxID=2593676 RepID=UPI00368FC8DB